MADVRALTRNDISLNTGSEQERTEYYDEICALSACTINKNFEFLFKQRPEIKELIYDNGEANIGTLKATLKAPRILIEPNQEVGKKPEIYYSLNIDKGKIYYPGSPTVTIDGWVIAVVASLDRMVASPTDNMAEDERFRAQDALDELQQTHDIPEADPKNPIKMRAGEYSIHRLFAAISQTAWTLPDLERSLAPVGPKSMTLKEWEQQSPQNHTNANKVKATLQSWASEHDYSSFFTLGLEVSVPNPVGDAPLRPTFLPTGLVLQNYPYIDDNDYINAKKLGRTPQGIIDDEWNCLVFCETCDGRDLPGKRVLQYSGNLAMPANTAKNRKEDIYGTFVLDHRLFFDTYLLPELQEFCLGSQVIPLKPKMYTDTSRVGTSACISRPVIACGAVPSDLTTEERNALPFIPPRSAKDKYYAFTQTGTFAWEWYKKLVAPGSKSKVHFYGDGNPPGQPVYRKYTTESEMWVKLKRKPNESVLIIEGRNYYHHWEGYFNNDYFRWDSQDGIDAVFWGKFSIQATWSIELNLAPKGVTSQSGVISPVMEKIDTKTWLPNDADVKILTQMYDIGGTHNEMKSDIEKALSESLKNVSEPLQKKFAATGRFFYPGIGTLKFGGPQLSDHGHVYCNIDYLPPQEGRIKLHVPSDKFPYGKERDRDSSQREIPGQPPSSGNLPRIKWIPTIEYDSDKGRATLTLLAENMTKLPAAFSRVRLIMSQVRDLDSYGLFSEEMWENKEVVIKRKEEAKKKKGEEKKKEEERKKEEEEERKKKEEEERKKKEEEEEEKKGDKETEKTDDKKDEKKEDGKETISDPKPDDKPDDQPDTDPESEVEQEETPTETWSLKYQGITNTYVSGLDVKPEVVGQDHIIEFSIIPNGKFPVSRKPRFVFSAGPGVSSFTLELEGAVRGPGKYVIQLNESWSDPVMTTNPTKTELADTWYTVLLEKGVKTGQFAAVTQAEAEKIQGVKKE